MIQNMKKLLWPEICPFCGKVYGTGICPACESKLNELLVKQPWCMKCGIPIRRMEQEYCHDCKNKELHFDVGRALWLHKPPVSHSIYQFKYHNQREFGKYYVRELLKQFESTIRKWNPDLIIPVPIHKRRRRKRGYNQAEILAREIARLTNIPTDSKILKRIRYTNPQKKLDDKLRKRNIQNAFQVRGDISHVRRVLLIDDIYTTGNTLNECAKKLKEAGVENVYFLTVSIGQGY